MSKKVVSIHTGVTDKNLNPDVILENLKGELSGFVIAGYDKEGAEVFSSSFADGGEALWLLERCKKMLLSLDDD
jgi:hypothetical protein